VRSIQDADALLVDQLDRQVPVGDPRCGERRLGRAPQARIVCLDLDQPDWRRSCGAWRSVYAV
jgi:hypothetical protein